MCTSLCMDTCFRVSLYRPWNEMVDRLIGVWLTFQEAAQLLCKAIVSFYIPTSSLNRTRVLVSMSWVLFPLAAFNIFSWSLVWSSSNAMCLPWCNFRRVYCAWVSLRFLNLWGYSYYQTLNNVLALTAQSIFFCSTLSLSFPQFGDCTYMCTGRPKAHGRSSFLFHSFSLFILDNFYCCLQVH